MAQNSSQSGKMSSDDSAVVDAQDQSSLAWKIFNAFIEESDLSLTEDELREYATQHLKANLSELPTVFASKFPQILVAYMNAWSGWISKKDFFAGQFSKQHYFNRFHKYMVFKMKTLNNTLSGKIMKTINSEKMDSKYKSLIKPTGRPAVCTGINKNPDFSPYAISIQCPPHMLNTIVFSNAGGTIVLYLDDVIMKQHLGTTWQDLSTAQLVNWPNVEVSFRTQDLCFVRRQATDYIRYLNFLPHECKKSDESIVESVESINANKFGKKTCYTYRFLEEYVKEYMSALKTIKDVTGGKLEEIQTILSQFLEDIRHINIKNSMATNAVVLFRLSQVPFIRNKKLVKSSDKDGEDARVGYCEIITPKVELVMLYFRAKQKDTPHISFEYTDKIKKQTDPSDLNSVLPYIIYKCTFCRVEFNTGNTKTLMIEHLKKEHKMEQHVRCTVCKKQFDVLNLAACRWRHKCITSTSTVTVL